jgi:hypothetical protein
MKTTAQRLSEAYCRPTTEEEWEQFGYFPSIYCLYISSISGHIQLTDNDWAESNRSKIPVQHFQDLLNDSIVGWRLKEDGFESHEYGYVSIKVKDAWVTIDTISEMTVHVEDSENASIKFAGIKTYTQLLTLIELMG